MRHTEFVAFEAGGDIGMGFRIHIRIDADADGGDLATGDRHLAQHIQLGFTFHIEAGDAGLQGLLHFSAAFAHTRKNHVLGLATSGQHPGQFATRHNVKTTAGLGKHLQHTQRGVGFHGVVHLGLAPLESTLIGRQSTQHGGFGVHKQRRAELLGHVLQRHVFKVQGVVAVGHKGRTRECGCGHGVGGNKTLGNCARSWASGSVGRYNSPFCPHPLSSMAMPLSRTSRLPRICFFIAEIVPSPPHDRP